MTNPTTYPFRTLSTSAAAWEFMRQCKEEHIAAGYPSLDGRNAVMVMIADDHEEALVDLIAARVERNA